MTIKVITYATHDSGFYKDLIKENPDIVTIGWNHKWLGYRHKLSELYKYIKNNLKDNDIVVICDAFDTKMLLPLKIIKNRFLRMNTKVLLSVYLCMKNTCF